MHVIVDGLTSDLLGGLEKTADVHVKSKIGETAGNHLGASVVTVLAHLCN